MKYVYSSANSLEAHMLVHMLSQDGIVAEIHGEHLTSLVGELPAENFIKIAVADEDYDKARALIKSWEEAQPAPPPSIEKPISHKNPSGYFLLGLMAGIGIMFLIPYISDSKDGYDNNKDGKKDVIYHYKGKSNFPLLSEMDANFDDTPDVVTEYDYDGVPAFEKMDSDFDGFFETQTWFENGLPKKTTVDINKDGVVDTTRYYENGIITKSYISTRKTNIIEFFKKGELSELHIRDLKNQSPIKINYYEQSRLLSADYDANRDGFLEKHFVFDEYENIIETRENKPGKK